MLSKSLRTLASLAIAGFAFYNMGINPTTLANVGAPGGSGRIYSVTVNPMVHPVLKGQ